MDKAKIIKALDDCKNSIADVIDRVNKISTRLESTLDLKNNEASSKDSPDTDAEDERRRAEAKRRFAAILADDKLKVKSMLADKKENKEPKQEPTTTQINVALLSDLINVNSCSIIAALLPMGVFSNPATVLSPDQIRRLCAKFHWSCCATNDEAVWIKWRSFQAAGPEVLCEQLLQEEESTAAVLCLLLNEDGTVVYDFFNYKGDDFCRHGDEDVPEGEASEKKDVDLANFFRAMCIENTYNDECRDEYYYGVTMVTYTLMEQQARFLRFKQEDIQLVVRALLMKWYDSAIDEDDSEVERFVSMHSDDVYEILDAHYDMEELEPVSLLGTEALRFIDANAYAAMYYAKRNPNWYSARFDASTNKLYFGSLHVLDGKEHRIAYNMHFEDDNTVTLRADYSGSVALGLKKKAMAIAQDIAISFSGTIDLRAKSIGLKFVDKMYTFDPLAIDRLWTRARTATEELIGQLTKAGCLKFPSAL